jgi:gamma-glutamylcyclotransferase (GGCT)/AIG2-like uncharacterized protein YtfP
MMPQDRGAEFSVQSGERLVFVYGTLRAGGSNDIRRLSPSPRYVAAGRVRGRLYHLGAYPGLVLGGPAWVKGEVYAVRSELEAVLDAIEEVWPQRSGQYLRREAMVSMQPPAPPLRCLLYELHPEQARGRAAMACGDWLAASAAGRFA